MNESPKTVRVRIAVCVAADGTWNAAGWRVDMSRPLRDDDAVAADACDCMPCHSSVHFIEADLPLPRTFEAEVVA